MNSETKRHIDAARQVLVGVVPNPTSQIEQITNALIYKFMDDMDQASIKAGGEPSFFIGELEPYAWTRIMDSRIGNQERMNLYGEALVKFSQAKQLPELFRGIFKSAFLPYRSPETLGLFLKEIDYFDYSHPEELGNAYEYLLSIMSSQGDAGQFRTPRHIIDFMVDVINPNKDDKVLDPACGTGGFLVSTYKHILEQHDGKNDPSKKEKPLTPDDRKKLMTNFEGYDIDPTMVRIAQVNMYLHQFKNPKIYQYDSLSQEERWNDKFDVILANPPFMSPKGGIKPHSKFSVPSNRSEVLFVDYIINHLRPKGRAGIIVPEGIIFQSGNAYKQLRKSLVNDGLYAVVSLPSGVFAPYSGVKTSILLFNNELAKLSKEILFVKVENDGFDLGATKRPINKNDLPQALQELRAYETLVESGNATTTFTERIKRENTPDTQAIHHDKFILAKKSHIAESGDYNLSGDRYKPSSLALDTEWPFVKIEDVVQTVSPPTKILKTEFKSAGSFPIIDQSLDEIAGWTNKESALVKVDKPVVIFGDHTCAVKYIHKSFAQGADGIKILLTNDKLIPRYLYYVLKIKPIKSEGYQRHFTKLKRYEVPLPPLEVQEQIVNELDGYAAIINGAKQIATNWKPVLNDIKEVDFVKVGEVVEFISGVTLAIGDCEDINGVPIITIADVTEEGNLRKDNLRKVKTNKRVNLLKKGDLLFNWRNGSKSLVGKTARFDLDGEYIFASFLLGIRPNKLKVESKYLWFILNKYRAEGKYMNFMRQNVNGLFNREELKEVEIPLPPLDDQKKIVEKIEAERELVEASKKLIKIYEDKSKSALEKLYGHDD